MEQRGVPTVTLVNERFVPLAKHVAQAQKMPNLPIVTMPPNVDFLPEQELQVVADKAFEEALALVAGPVAKPAV